MADNQILDLTADIVSAHVGNNTISLSDVPGLIQSVFAALTAAENPAPVEAPRAEPAVAIKSSVKHDYIVCLEDGAKLKMLKRYLRTNFNMSPEDYRAKWNLPRDYPMVAPAHAETRRTLAKAIGLGRKTVADATAPVVKSAKTAARKAVATVETIAATEPKKRGRPAKAAVTATAAVKPKAAPRKTLGIAVAKDAAQHHLNDAPEATPIDA